MPDETVPPPTSNPTPPLSSSPLQSEILLALSDDLHSLEGSIRGAAFQVAAIETELSTSKSQLLTEREDNTNLRVLNSSLVQINRGLQNQVDSLRAELEKYKTTPEPVPDPVPSPVPVPAPDPIPVPDPIPNPIPIPDISPTPHSDFPPFKLILTIDNETILFGGHSTRLSNGQIRYKSRINQECDALLDIGPNDKVRLTIERCYSDLPVSAPLYSPLIVVTFNGQHIDYGHIRLHHHNRFTLQLRGFDNAPLFTADQFLSLQTVGAIPTYPKSSLPITVAVSLADAIIAGKHPWTRTLKSPDPAEQYMFAIASWTGGFPAATGTEASVLTPWDVAFLKLAAFSPDISQSTLNKLWQVCLKSANTSGNYPIHYRSRKTGEIIRHTESSGLPNLLTVSNLLLPLSSGGSAPVPDAAHMHQLVAMVGLLTGEKFYLEEAESWAMFGLLSSPDDQDRKQGIFFSGQIRQTAWVFATYYRAYILNKGNDIGDYYSSQIKSNLAYMNSHFANSNGAGHRPSGVLNTSQIRGGNLLMQWHDPSVTEQFAAWNHFILAYVLSELVRGGFTEAVPILTHILNIPRVLWETASDPANSSRLSKFDAAWGNVAYVRDDLSKSLLATMRSRPSPLTELRSPLTSDYWAWWHSAVIAGLRMKQAWAVEAKKFHTQVGKALPIAWDVTV